MNRIFPIALAFALLPALAQAGAISSEQQKFSYAVGYQIGQSLQRQGVSLDHGAFAQAVQDVLAGAEPRLSLAEMEAALQKHQQTANERKAAVASQNAKSGQEFLAKNKSAKGVVERESGLQYQVLQEGTGKNPSPTSEVTVHYRGTLLNGQEFDSSYARGEPATFPVNGVILGWQEALPLMAEGAKWKLFIPSDLAYGEQGAGGVIGPNEVLVFEVELLQVH